MRIGFDAKRVFHNFTGLGNYSRDLLKGLVKYYPAEEYHLFSPEVSNHPRSSSFLDTARFKIHTSPHIFSALWRISGVAREAGKSKIDVFHGLSNEIPRGLRQKGIKAAVTIHDLIFLRYPEQYKAVDRLIYKQKSLHACRESDLIITVSEHTKSDILRHFQVDPRKIEVVSPNCDEQFYTLLSDKARESVRLLYQLPESYALYVGSIIPRKNLLNIVKAIHHLSLEDRLPLVIMGNGKSYLKEVKSYIHKHKLEKWFIFPDAVAFHDFPAIYQQAKMLIFPAIYEGFGIPVQEALWSQIPVITSRVSALPEVAGPGAFYIDPHKPGTIAEAIKHILHNAEDVQKRVIAGFAHVQQFHEKTLTTRLMHLYKKLVEGHLP